MKGTEERDKRQVQLQGTGRTDEQFDGFARTAETNGLNRSLPGRVD